VCVCVCVCVCCLSSVCPWLHRQAAGQLESDHWIWQLLEAEPAGAIRGAASLSLFENIATLAEWTQQQQQQLKMAFLLKSMIGNPLSGIGLGGGGDKEEEAAPTDPAKAAGMTREEYEEYQKQVVEEK